MSAAEEALEVAEIVALKPKYGKGALLVLGGALVGSVATWFVADKIISQKYEEKFEAELQESINFLVEHQMNMPKLIVSDEIVDDEVPDTDIPVVAEPLEPVEGERVLSSKVEQEADRSAESQNQAVQYDKVLTPHPFDGPETNLAPEEPRYEDPDISVISRDLFMENPTEWPQETVTYFSDGGVLNVAGDFVEDPELLIGKGTPAFGQMSDDANVVYIRNKKLQQEYEVLFDPGLAADFVEDHVGPEDDDELKHSLSELADRVNSNRIP